MQNRVKKRKNSFLSKILLCHVKYFKLNTTKKQTIETEKQEAAAEWKLEEMIEDRK